MKTFLIIYQLTFFDTGYTIKCMEREFKSCGIEYRKYEDEVIYVCTSSDMVKVKIIKERK